MKKFIDSIWFIDKIVTLTGIACIFSGIYQIYKPAAWIVLGIILSFPGGVAIGHSKKSS